MKWWGSVKEHELLSALKQLRGDLRSNHPSSSHQNSHIILPLRSHQETMAPNLKS